MIDHTGIVVADPARSRAFYEKALKPIGYSVLIEVPKEHTKGATVLGYGNNGKADFWVASGVPNSPALHVAFRVDTRKEVDEFYKAAIAAGGKDNGAPGLRAHYHPNYYGAFILDLDGHNIEAVCHSPH